MIGKYVIMTSYKEDVAEIIATSSYYYNLKIILSYNDTFIGNVFALMIKDLDLIHYRLATEEETHQINKRLIFQ